MVPIASGGWPCSGKGFSRRPGRPRGSAGASEPQPDRLREGRAQMRPSALVGYPRIPAKVQASAPLRGEPVRPGPGGSFALPAGSPTSGAHPINASRNCASFDGARGFWERGAPHLTVMATPLSPDLRRGAPRSVELRCEAFVFFPIVDFYSRPREMRGELPRLRPPRVESWRARRGGLEGAGKRGGVIGLKSLEIAPSQNRAFPEPSFLVTFTVPLDLVYCLRASNRGRRGT